MDRLIKIQRFDLDGGVIAQGLMQSLSVVEGLAVNVALSVEPIKPYAWIERQRGISATSSVMLFACACHAINLLDTPGHCCRISPA
jgi:hypothetical protein